MLTIVMGYIVHIFENLIFPIVIVHTNYYGKTLIFEEMQNTTKKISKCFYIVYV